MISTNLINYRVSNSEMVIQEGAKKVFNGVLFSVYQWNQEQFDGSFKIFEQISRPDSTIVIAKTQSGKILVTKQLQPGWKEARFSLIGGHIEDHQTPIENAQQELLEETGYTSTEWKKLGLVALGHKIDYGVYIYLATSCEKVQDQKLDPGEQIEIFEETPERVIELISTRKLRESEILMTFLENELTQESKNKFTTLLS